MMINPTLLKTRSVKQNHQMFAGGKYYLALLFGPGYTRATRRVFKRASEAEKYANRAKARWERLYKAAISAMMPTPAPQGDPESEGA